MKTKIIAFMVLVVILLSSCGPKRYKCGPYRRCNIEHQSPNKTIADTVLC